MTLSEFRTIIRMIVPSANLQRVTDAQLLTLLNKGVREVNHRGKVLRDEVYFNAVADQSSYVLTTISGDYVDIGESGVWYNRGTVADPNYDQLDAVDRKWLNMKYPNWVNGASGSPQYQFTESNKVFIYPAPDAALTDAFWFPDMVVKPTPMTAESDYPFTGNATERADLEPLDDGIIAYVCWMLRYAVGSDQKGIATKVEFEGTANDRIRLIRRRSDLIGSRHFKMKGRR